MPQRRIRVLQLVNSFAVSGAERVVTMLALHADPGRFEVIPCAVRRSGPLEGDLRTNGVQYHILGIQRRSLLTGPFFFYDFRRLIGAISKLVKDLSIDIIHAHLTENTFLGVLAASRAGGPCVCATVHSVVFLPRRGRLSPRGWLKRMAVDCLFSRADRIIVVAGGVAEALRSSTRIPPERIVTISNGVEPNPFLLGLDRNSLRQALGLPIDRQIVVSVGRLIRVKGYNHLERSLKLIPAERRPLTLIVGDGPERSQLESEAAGMGIAQDIRFLGHRRDVPALLAAADIFVLPSLWEGLPLALLEAMGAGLPVIVTSVGGNPEVVENGFSGLLVPPGDETALANALSGLLESPSQRERLGKAARDRFDQCFSLRRFVEAHEALYEEMLAEPLVPAMTHEAERARNLG